VLNVFSYGLGPGTGALAVYLFSKIRNQPFKIISLFGSERWYKAVAIFVVPIISMTFLSGGNYLKSFIIGLSVLVYCIGEERLDGVAGCRPIWLISNLSIARSSSLVCGLFGIFRFNLLVLFLHSFSSQAI
jgi:hypothetical protein